MNKLQDSHIFIGMQSDTDIHKQDPKYLRKALNVRISNRDSNTLMSLTSEKGNTKSVQFWGTYKGHTTLGDVAIIFTSLTQDDVTYDFIYKYSDTEFKYIVGSFRFGDNIEALSYYENEEVQKVYWVDGVNQPRMLQLSVFTTNVPYTEGTLVPFVPDTILPYDYFDFSPQIDLKEDIRIKRLWGIGGSFAPGVIQYAFTYHNKFGAETNIFYTTPLLGVTLKNRAGAPDETLDTGFKIDIRDFDNKFDFIRVYSIFRSSLNSTPEVRRLTDVPIKDKNPYQVIEGTVLDEIICNDLTNLTYSKDEDYYNWDTLPWVAYNGTWGGITYVGYKVAISALTGIYFSVPTEEDILLVKPTPGHESNYTHLWLVKNGTDYKLSFGYDTHPHNPNHYSAFDYKFTKLSIQGGVSFIDTGIIGEVIDPQSLLYIGSENITAKTLTAKDNTLFLGNIEIMRPESTLTLSSTPTISCDTRELTIPDMDYFRAMLATNEKGVTQGSGFKYGEYYRLGLQFQYSNGKWSNPIFVKDVKMTEHPSYSSNTLRLPRFTLSADLSAIKTLGYKRVRGVAVFPNAMGRTRIAQGIITPTISSTDTNNIPYAQSSWFFRPKGGHRIYSGLLAPAVDSNYTSDFSTVEVQGDYNYDVGQSGESQIHFGVNYKVCTLHSPDIELSEDLWNLDYTGIKLLSVGSISQFDTTGDMLLETSTPVVDSKSSGFIHTVYKGSDYSTDSTNYTSYQAGIISTLDYEDRLIDDEGNSNTFTPWDNRDTPVRFLLSPWQRTGSINNDIVRPNGTTRTSMLKKKVISNYMHSRVTSYSEETEIALNDLSVFNGDEISLVKLADDMTPAKTYYGNIDTIITLKGKGVAFSTGVADSVGLTEAQLNSALPSRSISQTNTELTSRQLVYLKSTGLAFADVHPSRSIYNATYIGDRYSELRVPGEPIRIKYKSSPHIVFNTTIPDTQKYSMSHIYGASNNCLCIADVVRPYNSEIAFGGNTREALEGNQWLPVGEPVTISGSHNTTVYFDYGDTWFSRYDCLKTYAYTNEDTNSIVEILSCMLESYINPDGRYDKNKGNESNLAANPTNFNLINPVYSQQNNFFTYRILDEDISSLDKFTNSVTWTLEKKAGAEVDAWTNITLSSLLDLDGTKGALIKLEVFNNDIFFFQERGIGKILFNSRVQIPASDGIPIEISNSAKVDGYRYMSEGVGIDNPKRVCKANAGLYFVDNISKNLYAITDSMMDVSTSKGMSNWFRAITAPTLHYDSINKDLYIVTTSECLCYSELLGQFTSFYSYEGVSKFFTLKDSLYTIKGSDIWKMFTSSTTIFEAPKPYYISFISNANSVVSKIFTNIELRADNEYRALRDSNSNPESCIFNSIRVKTSYQDTGEISFVSKPAMIKQKFRTWRIDIPRDKDRKLDRMTDNYAEITLGKDVIQGTEQLHDLDVIYYS